MTIKKCSSISETYFNKKFTSDCLVRHLWNCPVLSQNDLLKGSAVDNYRPISCLPLMWKLISRMLAKKMYSNLERGDVISFSINFTNINCTN